jgi:serine/threonine protein kinase, bacterial
MSLAAALYGRYQQTTTYTNGYTAPDVTDLAAQTYCLRTGDRCISLLHAPGGVITLVFSNGQWSQHAEGTSQCKVSGTSQVKITGEYPLPQPLEDPIPILTGHGHVEPSERTCSGGDFDTKLERIGD